MATTIRIVLASQFIFYIDRAVEIWRDRRAVFEYTALDILASYRTLLLMVGWIWILASTLILI